MIMQLIVSDHAIDTPGRRQRTLPQQKDRVLATKPEEKKVAKNAYPDMAQAGNVKAYDSP
jgi:hypothetical protein